MTGQPFAFATKGGDIVLRETLDDFAIKDSREASKSNRDPFQVIVGADVDNDMNQEGSKQAPELGITNYGFYGLASPPFNPFLLIALSEMNTYHDRCCRTKAIDIGGLDHSLVAAGESPSTENLDLIKQFLLDSDLPENLKNAEQDRQMIGWGCAELIRYGGTYDGLPQRLEQVHAHTVRIHRSKRKFMQTWNGFQRRWFKRYGAKDENGQDFDVHVLTGEEFPYGSLDDNDRGNELIYNPQYSPRTSYYGTPDYIPAIRTMLGDQAAVDYNLVFFKNFGVPAYAVYITGNFTDKPILNTDGTKSGKSEMQVAMEDRFQEVIENPHGSMVFMIPTRGGDASNVQVTFEKLSVDIKESSFRLYRLDNRDEIVTSHGVDAYRIGINATGTLGGNVSYAASRSYKSSVALPGQRRWELLINKVIQNEAPLGFGNPDQTLKLDEMDGEEEVAIVDTIISLVNHAIMTPNQAINVIGKRFGLEKSDEPAMDKHYYSGKVMEIEAPPATDVDGTGAPATSSPAAVVKALKEWKAEVEEARKKYETSN